MPKTVSRYIIGTIVVATVIAGTAGTLFFGWITFATKSQQTPVRAMDTFPSFLAYRGLYNVNPEEDRGEGYDPAEFAEYYHRTTDELPVLTLRECTSVADRIYTCLYEHAPVQGLERKDMPAFYRYAVHDNPRDRTARLELRDPSVLRYDLVKHLQSEVLSHHPLWRIFINAERAEDVVLIYPSVIWSGDTCDERELPRALANAAARGTAIQEAREGPQARQISYIQARALKCIPLSRDAFEVLGVFDNYKGNTAEVSLWIMQNERSEEVYPEMPEDAESAEMFTAAADGRFSPTRAYEDDAAYFVKQWVVRKEQVDSPIILLNEMDGTRTTLDLHPEQIVRDEHLKRGN